MYKSSTLCSRIDISRGQLIHVLLSSHIGYCIVVIQPFVSLSTLFAYLLQLYPVYNPALYVLYLDFYSINPVLLPTIFYKELGILDLYWGNQS